MCMQTTQFALTWDKGCRDYVGYGYKNLKDERVTQYKRKWVEAKGGWGDNTSTLKKCQIPSDDGMNYHPGFHIFLKEEDAKNYTRQSERKIIKVKFRGVLAFGTNETGPKYGPCVIATHMKFVEYCA
jgi:hypothetical protein